MIIDRYRDNVCQKQWLCKKPCGVLLLPLITTGCELIHRSIYANKECMNRCLLTELEQYTQCLIGSCVHIGSKLSRN